MANADDEWLKHTREEMVRAVTRAYGRELSYDEIEDCVQVALLEVWSKRKAGHLLEAWSPLGYARTAAHNAAHTRVAAKRKDAATVDRLDDAAASPTQAAVGSHLSEEQLRDDLAREDTAIMEIAGLLQPHRAILYLYWRIDDTLTPQDAKKTSAPRHLVEKWGTRPIGDLLDALAALYAARTGRLVADVQSVFAKLESRLPDRTRTLASYAQETFTEHTVSDWRNKDGVNVLLHFHWTSVVNRLELMVADSNSARALVLALRDLSALLSPSECDKQLAVWAELTQSQALESLLKWLARRLRGRKHQLRNACRSFADQLLTSGLADSPLAPQGSAAQRFEARLAILCERSNAAESAANQARRRWRRRERGATVLSGDERTIPLVELETALCWLVCRSRPTEREALEAFGARTLDSFLADSSAGDAAAIARHWRVQPPSQEKKDTQGESAGVRRESMVDVTNDPPHGKPIHECLDAAPWFPLKDVSRIGQLSMDILLQRRARIAALWKWLRSADPSNSRRSDAGPLPGGAS